MKTYTLSMMVLLVCLFAVFSGCDDAATESGNDTIVLADQEQTV